ncbi:MAG: argininosuccinate lyase [Pseudomonadota bacterium]
MSLWGGRFSDGASDLFKQYNDSLSFDVLLWKQDIQGSIAWSKALTSAGVLTTAEQSRLEQTLVALLEEYQHREADIVASGEEDIHSWVEGQLVERLGDLGKKLHTGRSRNDQVATDLRLWLREKQKSLQTLLVECLSALNALAKSSLDIVMPGYTHLQRAQPISVAHWAMAYAEMLTRDLQRLEQATERTNWSPLGSAALAGTSFPIDRFQLADELAFNGPTANSLDAVSDRDFVCDTLYCASLNFVHLSRLAEDVIFYNSSETDFFTIDDSMTSGSSLMPQKKNPDIFELIRGKTGRVVGHLQALLMTLKGLPTAYNKDLQEDKEGLFDVISQWEITLKVLTATLKKIKVNQKNCTQALETGYLNATDVAEYLVKKAMPFREAHHVVGQMTQYAIQANKPLEKLTLQELQKFSSTIEEDIFDYINVLEVIKHRDVYGGTAPQQIQQAIKRIQHRVIAHQSLGKWDVRQATIRDIDGIEALIQHWAKEGENLPRSRQDIINQIQDFLVIKAGNRLLGCGSLYVYHDDLAEIRSLGVAPNTHNSGIGRDLVNAFIRKTQQLKLKRLFVLTRVPEFFAKLGFEYDDKETLPEKVLKDCYMCPKFHACDETAMVYPLDSVPR